MLAHLAGPGQRADHEGRARGDEDQAGLDRGEVAVALQHDGQDEHEAREVGHEGPGGDAAQAHRSHQEQSRIQRDGELFRNAARLTADGDREDDQPEDSRGDGDPGALVLSEKCGPHQSRHADEDGQGPDSIDTVLAPRRHRRQVTEGRDDGDQHDRHVHQEDEPPPEAPGVRLHEEAPQALPGDGADPRGDTEPPHRPSPSFRCDDRVDERQHLGKHHRRAQALHGSARDENAGVRSQSAQRRRHREGRQPGDEHPAAPEQVTETAPCHQTRRVHEGITGDHQLQRGVAGAQTRLDVRGRHVDDEEVELSDEGRDQDGAEEAPPIDCRCHTSTISPIGGTVTPAERGLTRIPDEVRAVMVWSGEGACRGPAAAAGRPPGAGGPGT